LERPAAAAVYTVENTVRKLVGIVDEYCLRARDIS